MLFSRIKGSVYSFFHSGYELIIPALIGFFAYGYFSKFQGLNPTKTDWLLPFWNGNIDSATHYLGWEYFRSAPIFQWPLGKTPNLGPGNGSSIAMTDSIPLMAFLFKPLTHWYNGNFQYFGIWILCCFVLQSIAAWKLLTTWVEEFSIRLIGVGFFVVAPAFLDRYTFHSALAGHWILIFGIYLMLCAKFSTRNWLTLGIISILVQPYLAMMVSGMFVFSVFRCPQVFSRMSLYFGTLFLVAWQSGYFVFGFSNAKADGFGTFSSNGFSLVDPGFPDYYRMPWSSFIPNVMENPGQYEGFAFVGLGIVLLCIAVIAKVLFSRGKNVSLVSTSVFLFLVSYLIVSREAFGLQLFLICCILTICFLSIYSSDFKLTGSLRLTFLLFGAYFAFSLSNIIFLGDRLIWKYPIPDFVLGMISIARTSGRFVWPLMYLVIAVVVVYSSIVFAPSVAKMLLALLLVIQLFDMRAGDQFSKDVFARGGPSEYLPSNLWDQLGQTYSKVAFVPVAHKPRLFGTHPDFLNIDGWLWRDIGMLGVDYGWSLNSFYFGRSPAEAFTLANLEVTEQMKSGNFSSNTLYVFIESEAWEIAKKTAKENDLIGVLDGIPILAPGLNPCDGCDLSGFESR